MQLTFGQRTLPMDIDMTEVGIWPCQRFQVRQYLRLAVTLSEFTGWQRLCERRQLGSTTGTRACHKRIMGSSSRHSRLLHEAQHQAHLRKQASIALIHARRSAQS